MHSRTDRPAGLLRGSLLAILAPLLLTTGCSHAYDAEAGGEAIAAADLESPAAGAPATRLDASPTAASVAARPATRPAATTVDVAAAMPPASFPPPPGVLRPSKPPVAVPARTEPAETAPHGTTPPAALPVATRPVDARPATTGPAATDPASVPAETPLPPDQLALRDPPQEGGGAAARRAHKDAPKDYVALNGPIFEGWPKPQVAIVISGEQIGYIEPCGCAGLTNQKGGLKRRHTLIESLRGDGWPLVAIDLGEQVRRFGTQAEIKYRTAVDALVQIGYGAVGFGPADLHLPAEHLLGVAANLPGDKNPLVAANVGLFEFDSGFVSRYRILEAGGRKIGVTAVLGQKYQGRVNNDDIQLLPAATALRQIVPKMQQQADFLILLSHSTPEESAALARAFPQFQIIVTAGGAEEPPAVPAVVPGTRTRMVEVGHKGMHVLVLGLYTEEPKLRYQRVPLDARFADSPAMQQMLVNYQKELGALGLAGLGLKERPHPTGRKFEGSETCGDCHTKAHEIWENTPHAHATQTLVDLDPPRHHDPECLSCHATGWDPQGFFPFTSGFVGLKKTPEVRTNGCENCHGPAQRHALAELGELEVPDAERDALRAQLQMKLVPGEAEGKVVGKTTTKCLECHDLDNSPDFDFETYWPDVAHEGKE